RRGHAPVPPGRPGRPACVRHPRVTVNKVSAIGLAVVLAVLVVLSLGMGRYWLSPPTVIRVLLGQSGSLPPAQASIAQSVVLQVRLPRILTALLVGAALSSSGAAYQTMLRNPLVSPEIIGVAAGSAFGGSLGILIGVSKFELQTMTFVFGL